MAMGAAMLFLSDRSPFLFRAGWQKGISESPRKAPSEVAAASQMHGLHGFVV
jgi:hypothetical protein